MYKCRMVFHVLGFNSCFIICSAKENWNLRLTFPLDYEFSVLCIWEKKLITRKPFNRFSHFHLLFSTKPVYFFWRNCWLNFTIILMDYFDLHNSGNYEIVNLKAFVWLLLLIYDERSEFAILVMKKSFIIFVLLLKCELTLDVFDLQRDQDPRTIWLNWKVLTKVLNDFLEVEEETVSIPFKNKYFLIVNFFLRFSRVMLIILFFRL